MCLAVQGTVTSTLSLYVHTWSLSVCFLWLACTLCVWGCALFVIMSIDFHVSVRSRVMAVYMFLCLILVTKTSDLDIRDEAEEEKSKTEVNDRVESTDSVDGAGASKDGVILSSGADFKFGMYFPPVLFGYYVFSLAFLDARH